MLGIIGGTGIYNIDGLEIEEEKEVITPFGKPSAPLVRGKYGHQHVVFLPRHGKNHELMPHEVNYRANIYALKTNDVKQIIGISAVTSLQEEIKPGDFIIPNQYFDWTVGYRKKTFFGDGIIAHILSADPTCESLTEAIVNAAEQIEDITLHLGKTYACIDGPRLNTKAENVFLKDAAKCDIVGMTNVPEVFLAAEAQICYSSICITTDYNWLTDDQDQQAATTAVIARFGQNIEKVKKLMEAMLDAPFPVANCKCRNALKGAILTPEDKISNEKMELLKILQE